jgi:predicted GNAT family acetyltransferase
MIQLDETSHQFTLTSGSATAFLQFRRRAGRLIIIHTVVPAELEDQGVGGQLVVAALEYAASRNLIVVPICPFARAWLQSHPNVAATANIEWSDADELE